MKFSSVSVSSALYRGSNISAAAVVLNLLNKLRNRDKCEVAEHLIFFFRNEFNKFNNTGAKMLDSVIRMQLK